MPEAPAWRFQKITADMVETPVEHKILVGRVLTARDSEVIENGFVEMQGGKIVAVGEASERTDLDTANVVKTGGTILPGLFNSHAHLATVAR
jgi:imidazolonepropionase-like amidohydrolase